MAHINFLEPSKFSLSQFNLRNFEMNYFWMMVLAGLILLLMMMYGLVQRLRIGALNVELEAAIEAAKASGGAPAGPSGAQKATLADELRQRVAWSPILNAISNHTPDGISLNYIKGISTGARSMQIEGVGADVLTAARYKEELSQIPYFAKVLLQSSSERAPGTARVEVDPATGAKPAVAPSVPVSGGAKQLVFEIQGWLK